MERNGLTSSNDIVERPSRAKLWFAEMRAPFLTAAIIPIILGTVVAWVRTGEFNWFWFLLALFAGISIHIGSNVANDYHDHKSGTDDINVDYVRPFTGGSRMIQDGLMSPREVLAESILFFIIGATLGIYLSIIRGWILSLNNSWMDYSCLRTDWCPLWLLLYCSSHQTC